MKNSRNRRLRCRFTAMIAALVLFGTSERIVAQTMTENAVISTACGDKRCCVGFTFNTGSSQVDDIKIDLHGGTSDACWDWDCLKRNPNVRYVFPLPAPLGQTFTVTHTVQGHIDIVPNPTLPGGSIVQIILCPLANSPGCVSSWNTYSWNSSLSGIRNGASVGNNQVDTCTPPDGSYSCSDCDSVKITDNGTCSITVCFFIGGYNSTKMIDFHFDPPLVLGNLGANTLSGCSGYPFTLPPGWSKDPSSTNADIILTCPTALTPCRWLCFDIPKSNNQIPHTITAKKLDYVGSPCTPPTATFKIGADGTVISENANLNNYPNPVSQYGNFKTVIPFVLAGGGDAILTLVNASGSTVYSETSSFAGGGKHFFYLTAKDLPSGTYYYTIESPKGAVIVRHQLIVVK